MQQESEFGDFEEIKSEEQKEQEQSEADQQAQAPTRIRTPRPPELMGKIMQRLGGNRMNVKATDGKTRNCRVPGRYRRRLWLRPGDIIIIVPWELDDLKADVIYKYPPVAVKQLKKKGLLNNLKDEF